MEQNENKSNQDKGYKHKPFRLGKLMYGPDIQEEEKEKMSSTVLAYAISTFGTCVLVGMFLLYEAKGKELEYAAYIAWVQTHPDHVFVNFNIWKGWEDGKQK